MAKIKFNIDDIRPDGLRGPDDGLVSVSYEFCVPNNEAVLAEVRRIAPGVRFTRVPKAGSDVERIRLSASARPMGRIGGRS